MEGIKRLFRDTCQHGSGFRVSQQHGHSEVSVLAHTVRNTVAYYFLPRIQRRRNVTAEPRAQRKVVHKVPRTGVIVGAWARVQHS